MTATQGVLPERTLGRTGVVVSAVSLGAPSVGSDVEPGEPTSAAARDAARAMLESPFRLVDTSNSYGAGRSERALGAAIRELGGVPAGTTLVTKADRDLSTGVLDADRVRRSFEESVERLGVEHFSVYHLHDPYSVTFREAAGPGGAIEGLVRLREEGLVGHLGIAAGPLGLLREYVGTGVFDVVLTHNRYTLVDRSAEPFVDEMGERGVAVMNGAPFGGGILARGSAGAATYAYQPVRPEVVAWVRRVEEVCARFAVPLPAVALQFSLRHPGISTTLVGTTRPARVAETLEHALTVVPDDLWAEVERLGRPPVELD